jgi:hypothetical protein
MIMTYKILKPFETGLLTAGRVTGNFSLEPVYYVYFHRRNDTNAVFYVGKGKDRRAWSKGSRNKHWKHITEKHGYTVELVEEGLTEKQSFEREMFYVDSLGFENLVNLTVGGNTTTGYSHTDETRALLKQQCISRKESNPEWYAGCIERMNKLVASQKEDPDFYKKLGESYREHYHQLPEEVKLEQIRKKTAWLSDEDKVKTARERQRCAMSKPEYRQKRSVQQTQRWLGLSDEQRAFEIAKRVEGQRRVAHLKTGILPASIPYIINRSVVIPTIKKTANYFGESVYKPLIKMRESGVNLVLFKGFVIEEYKKELHGEMTTEPEQLIPLDVHQWHTSSAVKRSDGKVFLKISDAAKSFGDKQTDSTADWISRCMKKALPAMGYEWRRATVSECEDEILKMLNEQKEKQNDR